VYNPLGHKISVLSRDAYWRLNSNLEAGVMNDKERVMARIMQTVCAVGMGVAIAGLAGCDNSEKVTTVPPKPTTFAVGGSVSGLSGTGLVLQLNGANDLAVSANGRFNFPMPLGKGSAYSVTVKASPSTPIKQTCTVGQGSGNIAGAAIGNVAVTCVTNSYAVGGTVSGLSGKGLVLQLNGANDQAIAKNGKFIFPGIRLPDGSDYSVAIKTTPAKQKCIIKPINGAFDTDTLNIAAVTCSKKGRRN
jgi:hypothetical protein